MAEIDGRAGVRAVGAARRALARAPGAAVGAGLAGGAARLPDRGRARDAALPTFRPLRRLPAAASAAGRLHRRTSAARVIARPGASRPAGRRGRPSCGSTPPASRRRLRLGADRGPAAGCVLGFRERGWHAARADRPCARSPARRWRRHCCPWARRWARLLRAAGPGRGEPDPDRDGHRSAAARRAAAGRGRAARLAAARGRARPRAGELGRRRRPAGADRDSAALPVGPLRPACRSSCRPAASCRRPPSARRELAAAVARMEPRCRARPPTCSPASARSTFALAPPGRAGCARCEGDAASAAAAPRRARRAAARRHGRGARPGPAAAAAGGARRAAIWSCSTRRAPAPPTQAPGAGRAPRVPR